MFWELNELSLPGPVGGGGGGGGACPRRSLLIPFDDPSRLPLPSLACFCSIYALMNSEFSSIWSSVMPISNSSPRMPLHEGSTMSKEVPLLLLVSSSAMLLSSRGGIMDCWVRCSCGCGCGRLGADEDLWPCSKLDRPPRRLCDFPFVSPPLAAGPRPEP